MRRMRNVQEWNKKFDTLNGKHIVETLMPFYKKPFLLREECKDMRGSLRRSLFDLGITFRGFEIIHLERVCGSAARLLEIRNLKILKRFEKDLMQGSKANIGAHLMQKFRKDFVNCMRSQSSALAEYFEESVGSYLQSGILAEIERYVPEEMREDLREALRGILWDCAWSNVRLCLYYEIGFLVAGKFHEAELIKPLTKSFAMGNLPLGFVDDNLLVVVK